MDPFEILKIVQDVYVAGLRAQAKAQTVERPILCKSCGGSNLTLIRKDDPDEEHSMAAMVCKGSRLAMQ